MTTITAAQEQAIRDKLASMPHIPKGLGTEDEACSIAAINLALSGTLTDDIPDCMSVVIGKWIIPTQDKMPDEMRNSAEWRELLPLAAGTGRDPALEEKRTELILQWMWTAVLPVVQSIADKHGFGIEWREMLEKRDRESALQARDAAAAYTDAYAAADAAAYAAYAAYAAADAYAAAGAAVGAATVAATALDQLSAWKTFNPAKILRELFNAGVTA